MKARAVPATSARKTVTAGTNGRGPALQAPLIDFIVKKAEGHFRTFTISELVSAVGRETVPVQQAMIKIIAGKKLANLAVVDAGRVWEYDPSRDDYAAAVARVNQPLVTDGEKFPPTADPAYDGAFTKKQSATIASLMDPYVPGEKIEILVVGRTSDGTVILEMPTGELIRTRA